MVSKMYIRIFIICLVMLLCLPSLRAQKFSISTNLLEYADLGTFNADFSVALSRRWSLTAGARYNPFSFGKGEREFRSRQQSYSIGVRAWPWHTWSGWWFASKLRYQEYNTGGFKSPRTEEGDRFGAGLYGGYTLMLSKHWNIEFGIGAWTGVDWYKRYSCQKCGLTLAKGRKWFLRPDDIMISVAYVF